jgi:hypothetical protein
LPSLIYVPDRLLLFCLHPCWGLGLWCLTSLSTIFQLYRGSHFIQYKEDSGVNRGPSWSGFYASWIFIYLCNQCLSPLML